MKSVKEIDYINKPFKKFVETLQINDTEWEVDTPDGWVDINASGKTIKYDVWRIELENKQHLECADNHIVLVKDNNEIVETYTKDLCQNDLVLTKEGFVKVKYVEKTSRSENMYDLEIGSESKIFYTNDIASHNSIWLANLAASCVKEGYNTAYLSFEMRDRSVVKRLGANLLGVKMSEYNQFAMDKEGLKQKIKNASAHIVSQNMKVPGKLFVKEFPTSSASVQDVERYLKKMEEMNGMKFKTVFVDYINIMRNWRNPNSENTYMKIKQLAEDLRAMAMRNDWAVITATQVNRAGFDSTDLGYSNISESAALIHTVDALFGIIQDPVMHGNSEYILKLIANRNDGYKNTKKKFKINYDYMKITEDMSSEMWTDD